MMMARSICCLGLEGPADWDQLAIAPVLDVVHGQLES
jgi:hypothetical protein